MPLIEYKGFATGYDSENDLEDVQDKAAVVTNVETDQIGRMYKRNGIKSLGALASGHAVKEITRFSHKELSGDSQWLIYSHTPSALPNYVLLRFANDNLSTITEIKNFGAVTAPDLKMIPMTNAVRFANGIELNAGVLQYIDNQYFLGDWQPTAAWDYDDADLRLPTKWYAMPPTTVGTVTGANPVGHYYYKYVPIFDGNQEGALPDKHSYIEITNTNKEKVIEARLEVDTDNYNKRITAVKVYRGFLTQDLEPYYYHIKTIPLNTKSDHTDVTTVTNAKVGRILYSPGTDLQAKVNEWKNAYSGGTVTEIRLVIGGTTYTYSYGTDMGSKIIGHYIETTTNITAAGEGSGSYILRADVTYDNSSNNQTYSHYGADGYYGAKIVHSPSWDSWKSNDLINHVVHSTANVNTSTNYNPLRHIKSFTDKVIVLWDAYGTQSNSDTVKITPGYGIQKYSSGKYEIAVFDDGIADGGSHPLSGKDKLKVNYKYGAELSGRYFVGNVRLDPDDKAEDHKNMIIYSELGQYDVLPIANYILINDPQGGEITGLTTLGNYLVVFMEYGVHVLTVPSYDPTRWSLEEAYQSVGCIAPHSIENAENMVFFAGADNLYALNSSLQISEIADDIKSIYRSKTIDVSLSAARETRTLLDIKKKRLLCRFGTDKTALYVLDLKSFFGGGTTNWSLIDNSTNYYNNLCLDENLEVHTVDGAEASKLLTLYEGSGSTESFSLNWKSGITSIADMGRGSRNMVRRVTMAYDSKDPITATMTFDKNPNLTKTMTFPANSTSDNKFYSAYVGRRAKFIQLDLKSTASANYDTKIEKMEIEVDG